MRTSVAMRWLLPCCFLGFVACASTNEPARDPAAVRRSLDEIKKHPPDFSALYACGDRSSARTGTVVLSISIASSGNVSRVTRREGTDMPDEVVDCMSHAAQWLRFPMPEVDHVSVRYRFLIGGGTKPSVADPIHE